MTVLRKTRRCCAGLMALWLLVSLSLPPLWRMDCCLTGKAVITWVEAEPCMPVTGDNMPGSVRMDCCDFDKVVVDQPVSEVGGGLLTMPHFSLVVGVVPFAVTIAERNPDHDFEDITSRPPPRQPSESCAALRVFRL